MSKLSNLPEMVLQIKLAFNKSLLLIEMNTLAIWELKLHGKTADYLKKPLAGTKFPVDNTSVDQTLNYLKVTDPKELETILSDVYLENYGKVIHKSLEKSGYSISQLDFLVTNQVKKAYPSKSLIPWV